MKLDEIKAMQRKLGVVVDGVWGPISTEACKRYLRSLMPAASQWPAGDDASLRRFYGPPGTEANLVRIEFPFRMLYEGKVVKTTLVHRRCADSLLAILREIGDRYGNVPGVMEEATDYGGVYNNRNMRGGSRPSVHAYGAAIDLDADENGNLTPWPQKADMPLEIMECFARQGWTSAGAFWGRDAMHHQATKP